MMSMLKHAKEDFYKGKHTTWGGVSTIASFQVREISLGLAMTRQGPHAPSLIIKASVDGLLREALQLAYAYEFLKWK